MQQILEQLKIKADVVGHESNGIMTKYYLRLQPGGKVNKIENCATEIALGLKSYSIPIIRPIPEEGLISVELLINQQDYVGFEEFTEELATSKHYIPAILGRDYAGNNIIADIARMPHLLIAGTTGSGKSVMLHSIICSLMAKEPTNIHLALIDPKNVEFSYYNKIKQLMYPVVNYADEALEILSDLVEEMEKRFKRMSKASVNEISEFNIKYPKKPMPYIVLIIDEFSDMMQMSKKIFQFKLSRLAQKSRACGIHIIIATQRPSADVVTGIIKANFPARISCRVTSAVNSRVVLDKNGAEKLLGRGDALIDSGAYDMLRFKGAYLDPKDIKEICDNNKRSKMARIWNYLRH